MIVGVCRLIANHLHLAFFESIPEVRVLPSTGITRLQRSYYPVRLPPVPPPESNIEAATLADSCTTAKKKHGYSITSSAIARSCGGILRPSALAVLALMTNSTLVDCVTGRSRGVSPLRMRAAQTPTRR